MKPETADYLAQAGTAFDLAMPRHARRRLTPRRPGRSRRRRVLLAAACVVLLSVLTSGPPGLHSLDYLIVLILTLALCLSPPARGTAAAWTRRRYRHQFIGPADLDQPAAELLRRAQRATGAVLSSAVHQAGQLDDAANVTVLSDHEWDIAQLLRDTTRLRARHSRIAAPGAAAAPAVAAVARPQQEILRQVDDAVTARVEALEAYAARVRAADEAYLTWQQALALAGLNDGFIDLLARTATDSLAAEQISLLASQARAAEQDFRGALCDTRSAAEPIALQTPPPARPASAAG